MGRTVNFHCEQWGCALLAGGHEQLPETGKLPSMNISGASYGEIKCLIHHRFFPLQERKFYFLTWKWLEKVWMKMNESRLRRSHLWSVMEDGSNSRNMGRSDSDKNSIYVDGTASGSKYGRASIEVYFQTNELYIKRISFIVSCSQLFALELICFRVAFWAT